MKKDVQLSNWVQGASQASGVEQVLCRLIFRKNVTPMRVLPDMQAGKSGRRPFPEPGLGL